MDTATAITIAQIFLAPFDGQPIAMPPVLDVIARVLGGLLTATIAVAMLLFVAWLIDACRTREGRAGLVATGLATAYGALQAVVHVGALFMAFAAGTALIFAAMLVSVRHPNLAVGDALAVLSGVAAVALLYFSQKAAGALLKRLDTAVASRLTA
ncbi:hypothetical protein WK24_15190 [Burkholderia vietnamiensis]|uniref:hypothetical protein n=1 Tax=Burkholderia cepacia complex TaxID=87882 RepID=UPI000756F1D4|nr:MULTISPECIES: hypothetical protein [Burkholderia cepacia complex]KVR67311.1 hypothetical protein WK24_15190 [Burkholderia vietnamiensis]MCA7919416.1 hypothetical protein [Burkholderia contaminans]UUX37160.1 hypothetical protein NTJ56_17745 [Burkholderia contaminans]